MSTFRRRHRSITTWGLLLVVVVLSWTEAARAADSATIRMSDPRQSLDALVIDFSARGLFHEAVREALESGLPARIGFRVELWRERSRFWDQQLDESEYGYRVLFDVLEERYQVYDDGGSFVASTARFTELEDLVAGESDYDVIPLRDLDAGVRYYVLVEALLEPLSVEEVRDLEQWIRGSMRPEDRRSRLGNLSDQLLGILKNKLGLGERRALGKTPSFRPEDLERSP